MYYRPGPPVHLYYCYNIVKLRRFAPPVVYNLRVPKEKTMTTANYETCNVAFHLGGDEFVFNTAKACVTYCGDNETPWDKFVRCMTEGQIGRMLGATTDGVRWDDPKIDTVVMNKLMKNL